MPDKDFAGPMMGGRRLFVGGNWKMNGSRSLIDTVCNELAAKKDTLSNAEVVLAPPFPYLSLLATRLESQDCHKTVFVAAQTVSAEGVNGAFTGEVSAAMLHDLAVPWCIVGHSERRSIFAESSEVLPLLLLSSYLLSIVCLVDGEAYILLIGCGRQSDLVHRRNPG